MTNKDGIDQMSLKEVTSPNYLGTKFLNNWEPSYTGLGKINYFVSLPVNLLKSIRLTGSHFKYTS